MRRGVIPGSCGRWGRRRPRSPIGASARGECGIVSNGRITIYANGLRAKTRITCVGDQSPPRAVGIRRSLSPTAIARSDVAPAACGPRSLGRDQPPAHPRRCVCAQLNTRTRAVVTIGTRLAVAHGIRSPLSVSWSSSKARHGCDSNYLPGRSTCRARSKLRRQSIGSKPCRF